MVDDNAVVGVFVAARRALFAPSKLCLLDEGSMRVKINLISAANEAVWSVLQPRDMPFHRTRLKRQQQLGLNKLLPRPLVKSQESLF